MANKKAINLIEKNAKAVELFAQLEQMSSEQPEVFDYFISRYSKTLLDNYPWGEALWRTDEQSAGFLDKFMPYVSAIVSVIILVIMFVKK